MLCITWVGSLMFFSSQIWRIISSVSVTPVRTRMVSIREFCPKRISVLILSPTITIRSVLISSGSSFLIRLKAKGFGLPTMRSGAVLASVVPGVLRDARSVETINPAPGFNLPYTRAFSSVFVAMNFAPWFIALWALASL